MKNFLKIIATSLLISFVFYNAYAEDNSNAVDDLIPIRILFEVNNYNVSWQNETKKILIFDKTNVPKWSFSLVDNKEYIDSDTTFVLLDEVSYISINTLRNFDLANGLQSKKEVIQTYQQDSSNVKIGSLAPNFIFSKDYEINDLYSLIEKDKKNILIFWASWCPQCKNSIEFLNSGNLDKDRINIITISIDDHEQKNNNFLVFHDFSEEVFNSFNGRYIPTAYIIGSDNKIIDVKIGGKEVYNMLSS